RQRHDQRACACQAGAFPSHNPDHARCSPQISILTIPQTIGFQPETTMNERPPESIPGRNDLQA
ncbi:MAG: hypothetical protein KKF15_05820, partial [Alphaproteobacteria bacterium]|nr:hypothetical protein [Alphaproteobacteria bacterium]